MDNLGGGVMGRDRRKSIANLVISKVTQGLQGSSAHAGEVLINKSPGSRKSEPE